MTESKKNRLLLAICFIVYSISYIGKYSYSANIKNVISDFAVSNTYAGYVTSAFFFCYGAGQIINGLLCERLDSKKTIIFVMLSSSAITFLMFFIKSIIVMAVLWGINGLVLSALWCHSIKLLATIKDKTYMAKSVTTMSITLPVGVVMSYGLSALFTYFNFWKLSFIFSAILLLSAAAVFFIVFKMIESNTDETEKVCTDASKEEPKKPQIGVSVFKLLGIAVIPLFCISIAAGIIRDGSSTWMPVLLNDAFGISNTFSILLTMGLPLMGVFTAVIATWLIGKTKSIFISFLTAGTSATAAMIILTFLFESSAILTVILFMLISISAYILSETITSILPLYYKGKLKSGQTAGIVNAFIYFGSTLGSLFSGKITDDFGWSAFMIFLLSCAAAVVIMAALGILILRKKKFSKEQFK